jgi:hypothetical protein
VPLFLVRLATNRIARPVGYVLFTIFLAATVLIMFFAGPPDLGVGTGLLAVVLGGILNATSEEK